MKTTVAIFIFVSAKYFITVDAFQCRNHDNNPVDWFVGYKLPKLKHDNEFIDKGLGYLYITSENDSNWTLSQYSINDSNSIIAVTLNAFYTGQRSEMAYIFYNDQPPNSPYTATKGHTKGVILSNSQNALWLVHSVPKFPKTGESYFYPKTATRYGQSFLCISLNLANLNKIGIQLQYNEPYIYAANIPYALKIKLNEISNAAMNSTIKQPPWYKKSVIESVNGVDFISFAKYRKFGKDIYEDWVAPELQSDLYVETWPNGAGKLASNCTKPYKVFNVENVEFPKNNVNFSRSHDHSKWAVSSSSDYICIGDINRMEEQKFRGGGTVCLKNIKLSQDYKSSITAFETCNNIK